MFSYNDDSHWVLSFGEGRQAQTSNQNKVLQWSQFGAHQLSLPIMSEQSKSIGAMSTFSLDESHFEQRQEKYLRVALSIFVSLMGYLLIDWPKQSSRESGYAWGKSVLLVLLVSLYFMALMALVSQGSLTVSVALGWLLALFGLRRLHAFRI